MLARPDSRTIKITERSTLKAFQKQRAGNLVIGSGTRYDAAPRANRSFSQLARTYLILVGDPISELLLSQRESYNPRELRRFSHFGIYELNGLRLAGRHNMNHLAGSSNRNVGRLYSVCPGTE